MEHTISLLNYTDPAFNAKYSDVLNWIHYEVEPAKLKAEFVAFCKTVEKDDIASLIPVNSIGIEGAIAYCLNRGALLSPKSRERIIALLEKSKPAETDIDPEWEDIQLSIQGRNVVAYVNCYSLIDNAKTMVLNGKLQFNQLASTVRKIIENHNLDKNLVTKQLLKHYITSLQEARRDPVVKHWVKPLTVIVDTINLMLGNKTTARSADKAAKHRKMTSTVFESDRVGQKAATKITYLSEDPNFGIKSLNPTTIIGAQTVVIFNTKTRHCEVYFAKDGQKLSVKGSRITNFDETISVGKIVRNPEDALQRWVSSSTTKRVNVLLESVKGKRWTLSGKLNSNSVIVNCL